MGCLCKRSPHLLRIYSSNNNLFLFKKNDGVPILTRHHLIYFFDIQWSPVHPLQPFEPLFGKYINGLMICSVEPDVG